MECDLSPKPFSRSEQFETKEHNSVVARNETLPRHALESGASVLSIVYGWSFRERVIEKKTWIELKWMGLQA